MPVKSALSQFRKKISFKFFEDIFYNLLIDFESKRLEYKGLRVYATDGDQLQLPLSNDILSHGYRGYPTKNKTETYFPRMYLTHTYDIISGVTKKIKYSHENKEYDFACKIATELEKNSLTIYDRLFFSTKLVLSHNKGGNFFLAKCKKGSTFKDIIKLVKSKNKKRKSIIIENISIQLIKIRNSKSKEFDIFATNLPKDFINAKEIQSLYSYRWNVETSFRDFTSTMKAEQWHSKSINGVLQELFTAYWLINISKIEMGDKFNLKNNFMNRSYLLPNFKLILNYIKQNIVVFIFKISKKITNTIKHLIKVSTEKRKKLSRSSPRLKRSYNQRYICASIVNRRA